MAEEAERADRKGGMTMPFADFTFAVRVRLFKEDDDPSTGHVGAIEAEVLEDDDHDPIPAGLFTEIQEWVRFNAEGKAWMEREWDRHQKDRAADLAAGKQETEA